MERTDACIKTHSSKLITSQPVEMESLHDQPAVIHVQPVFPADDQTVNPVDREPLNDQAVHPADKEPHQSAAKHDQTVHHAFTIPGSPPC
jgi:hypothetical protein